MAEYRPWNDTWKEQVVYLVVPPQVDNPVEMSAEFAYPIFLAAFEQKARGDEFWKAVAGAMIFVLGHDPGNQENPLYVEWLSSYNPAIVKELLNDGANQAVDGKLETAIWLFQAAVLLEPVVPESHYNLGLAYYQLGLRLFETEHNEEAKSCLKQAVQYLQNTLELDPKSSLATYNLGFIYRRMGLQEESEKYLEKSILLELEKVEPQIQGGEKLGERVIDGFSRIRSSVHR